MRTLLACFVAAAACCAPRQPVSEATNPAVERVVIDTRMPDEFAAEHQPGAINLQLEYGQLERRVAAYVPEKNTPIGLVAADEDAAERAAGVLAEAGYTDVALASEVEARESLPTLTTAELAAALASDAPPTVIDVRSAGEFETGTIDGALLFDHDEAPDRIGELDPEADYVVICEGGFRSSQLASLLKARGFTRVRNAIEGMSGWREQ